MELNEVLALLTIIGGTVYITFQISCGIKPSCAIYKLIAVIVLDITLYFELHLVCIDEIWKSIRDIQNSIFEIIGYLKI